jgi:hypothetical protein
VYQLTIHACAPKKITKKSLKNPWWNINLQKIKKKLSKLYKKSNASPSNSTLSSEYSNLSKQYYKDIKSAKNLWFKKSCTKIQNPWTILKIINRSNNSPPPALLFNDTNGTPFTCPHQNASYLLNELFPENNSPLQLENVHTIEKVAQHMNCIKSQSHNFIDISTSEVSATINSFRPFSAPGPDFISPAFLQWTNTLVAPILTNIYNACMSISYFPYAFKTAKVITIPKQDSTSLRPLSMLSVIGKCLEKIILK